MTRFRSALALVVASLLLLAACGGTSGGAGGAAATVNGRDIADADFRDQLRMFSENPEVAQTVIGVLVSADGSAPEGRVDSAFAASVLELEILLSLLDAEVDERGLEITDADLEETRTDLEQQNPQVFAQLSDLPEDYVDGFIEWNTQARVLQESLASEVEVEEVTDDDVRAYYDENAATYQEVCASHVLLETEEEAQAVLDELEGGADFATVASERSTDPSAADNGGDLGCASPAQYVAPFAEAISEGPIGELLGPVETDFGFHVILVSSREATPFEDVSADIRAQLEAEAAAGQSGALGAWLQEAVADAEITVNSRYGEWDAANARVVPPEAPEGAATVAF